MVHAVVVNPILERFATPERADTGEGGRMLTLALSRPLQTFALIPGEDGLCFVPLLLIGITPLSAAIVAAAFAALHYPDYQLKHCVPKGFICFLVALIVVPHGLVAAVIGHLLLDALAIAGWHFARES
jgi:hypothetical protein